MSTKPARTIPPYVLPNLDDVPDTLVNQIRADLPKDQEISGIFVIPAETYSDGFHRKNNPLQALVFTDGGVLKVFASENEKISKSIWIRSDSVARINLKLVLLYGKLEIWSNSGGRIQKIQAEYNTVAHPLLTPFLRALIRNSWRKTLSPGTIDENTADFNEFVHTSYSFYNGIMLEAIQPGEQIHMFVYQPELRGKWLNIIPKKVFPKTLVVLTNKQLIFLQEDLSYKVHYEWLFTFIPIDRVLSIKREEYKEWHKFTFHLDTDTDKLNFSLLISNDNVSSWQNMLDHLELQI